MKRPGHAALFSAVLLAAGMTHSVADPLAVHCEGCHGTGGISRAEHMPSIAGINFRYFYARMQDYRKDRRRATVMDRIAKGYKSGQLQRLALFYGRQTWSGAPRDLDPRLAAQGGALHRELCEKCHKDDGRFQDKDTPPLAGQAPGYLLLMMQDYRDADSGLPQPPLMQERLEKLDDPQLRALSAFYVGVRPATAAGDE